MAVPIVLSPATAYLTKNNILFPGSDAQATAAETAADTRIEDVLPAGMTVSITGGTIEAE